MGKVPALLGYSKRSVPMWLRALELLLVASTGSTDGNIFGLLACLSASQATTLVLTTFGWIAIDVLHACVYLDDPLTFHLAPQSTFH